MKRPLDAIVADIADDVSVDWGGVNGASSSGELVREFRIIAAIGAGRDKLDAQLSEDQGSHAFAVFFACAVAISVVKIVLAVCAAVATEAQFGVGPAGLTIALFAVFGMALLAGGGNDRRTRTLGGLFVIIASVFVEPYLRLTHLGTFGQVLSVSRNLIPEAFLGVALWEFAWVFPSEPRGVLDKRLGVIGSRVSVTVALLLFAANILITLPTSLPTEGAVVHLLARFPGIGLFWPVVLLTATPALPYLVWKSGRGTVEERGRAMCLSLGIVAGLAPFVMAMAVSPFFPALDRPPLRDWVGAVLYLALASIVPTTAYTVAVRRVVNVHLVIRGAVQHALARQFVWAVILGSVSYVAVSLYVGRERPLVQLLSDQAGLMSLTALGLLALTFRPQLLQGIDRWFQRGAAEDSEVMVRLANDMSGRRNLRDLHATLIRELTRTFRSDHVAILAVNDEGDALVCLEGRVRPLPMTWAIPGLFRSSREGLCLRGDAADPMARLLPRQDREWLAELNVEWIFPLFGSSESLLGLVCLGEGHGPSYSKRDRVLVAAMADQLALRMENLSLHQWPAENGLDRQGRTAPPVDWSNERAMQCPSCMHVAPPEATTCVCGSRLQPASVPLVLNGKFRVERVLGSGGMGVVYLALDTTLGRRVAVKAMPTVTPRHVARLQREARAMASVLHPNLAMIYGAELWRDVPVLVVEYLDGGTLLDGLRAGPISVDDALDLGIVLADALDRMHLGGLLHRDIKPSNIGYTADGLPKLLDFGLAAMLDRAGDELMGLSTVTSEANSRTAILNAWSPTATRTATQQLVGTPLYLSPEALAGEEPDASFDLWSLGLVLYESICGRHPLAGYPVIEAMRRTRSVRLPDVRDFCQDCPATVAAFLNDALSLSKERRPATAAEFRMQLQSIRHGLAASAHSLHSSRSLY